VLEDAQDAIGVYAALKAAEVDERCLFREDGVLYHTDAHGWIRWGRAGMGKRA